MLGASGVRIASGCLFAGGVATFIPMCWLITLQAAGQKIVNCISVNVIRLYLHTNEAQQRALLHSMRIKGKYLHQLQYWFASLKQFRVAFKVLPISTSSESVIESLKWLPSSASAGGGATAVSQRCDGLPGHCRLSANLALSCLAVGSSQTICSFWDGSVFMSMAVSLETLGNRQRHWNVNATKSKRSHAPGVLSYLRASSVRLVPPRSLQVPSGVWGDESCPLEPALLSLAEARLPDVSLVADMISWSCLCKLALISKVSDTSARRRSDL